MGRHLEGLPCDPGLLGPLTSRQIHQVELAGQRALLPFSQHAHLHMDGEDSVGPGGCAVQSMACC